MSSSVQSSTFKYSQVQSSTIKCSQIQSSKVKSIKYSQVKSSTVNYSQVQSSQSNKPELITDVPAFKISGRVKFGFIRLSLQSLTTMLLIEEGETQL